MTCLGVTETVRFGIQTSGVQDNLGDLFKVGFLLRSLRGQDLVTIYQIWTHNEGKISNARYWFDTMSFVP